MTWIAWMLLFFVVFLFAILGWVAWLFGSIVQHGEEVALMLSREHERQFDARLAIGQVANEASLRMMQAGDWHTRYRA